MNAEPKLVDLDAVLAAKAAQQASKLPIFNAYELGRTEFPPIKFIVPNLLPEGATILAGRPKLGKSWLGLDIALAVATGSEALGVKCEQGAALYLCLEDNKRRIQSRMQKLSPAPSLNPWPASLTFATQWRRHDAGGVDDIRTWAASVENPRLAVVDVLAAFRGARSSSDDSYSTDYEAIKGLQELAGELQLAVLIIHHVRKSAGEVDPFEKISGTLGLSGAADTALVLDRDGNGCSLYGRGRDIEEFERAVTFDKWACRWQMLGNASEIKRSDERSIILDVLGDADDIMSVSEIVTATGMSRNACDQLLYKMSKDGEINKAKRGHYYHPDRADLTPSTPHKIDKKIRN